MINLALRRWFWLVSRSDGDLVHVITCCAGHLYHILFTDVILQNAKSIQTLAVVALFNVGQMLLYYEGRGSHRARQAATYRGIS